MAFTDKDREKLTQVHTDTQWIKKEHDRRLAALEAEDKLLHSRISATRKIFLGLSSGIGIIAGAIIFWVKSLKGG